MKKWFVLLLCLMMLVGSTALADIDSLISLRTTQAFTEEPVSDADLERIVQAGLSATSALNTQPWFFAVVTNADVMADISVGGFGGMAPAGDAGGASPEMGTPPADMPAAAPATSGSTAKAGLGDSPVAIVIYMKEGGMTDPRFDCGLACQNMVIAASELGYGTKIVSSPTMALNGERHDEFCEQLGVDISYDAVAVLLIGHAAEDADAVTSASVRNAEDEKVSYIR